MSEHPEGAVCPHGRLATEFCPHCASQKVMQEEGPLAIPKGEPRMEAKLTQSAFRQLAADVGAKLNRMSLDDGVPTEVTMAAGGEATKALRFLQIFLTGTTTQVANALGYFETEEQ